MRLPLSRVVLCCLALAGCHSESDFPLSAVPFAPPAQFRAWWEIVESCSGRRARFDDVKWFQVLSGEILVQGESAVGAWFADGNRIALLGEGDYSGPLVRHEMLHAILGSGKHSTDYFEEKCGDVVVCGRVCGLPKLVSDPTPLSLDQVELSVEAYPRFPSLSLHEGRMSFVLKIRNTTSATAYLPQYRYALGWCASGVLLSSESDPDRIAFVCDYPFSGGYTAIYGPGETRSFVFDIDLQNLPDGEGPFFAERITVGGVLADNVRGTTMVTMRP